MGKKPYKTPTELPLRYDISDTRIGVGQDNDVHRIEIDPNTRDRIGGYVLKIGHPRKGKVEAPPIYTAERAMNDLQFKVQKYRLLKTFLGDQIPNSAFYVGTQKDEKGRTLIKPNTIQQEVPQFTLGKLAPDQRNSDELRGSMYQLAKRLRNMYDVLDRAKAIVEEQGDKFLVDAALDLGTFSDYVREHPNEDPRNYNYKHMITGYKESPNLLIDPETLKVSCVDFGAGEWSNGLGDQLALVYDIAAHDDAVQANLPPVQQAA